MTANSPWQPGRRIRTEVFTLLAAIIAASFMLFIGAKPVLAQELSPADTTAHAQDAETTLFLPFAAVPAGGSVDPDGPICRFGVNVTRLPVVDFDVAPLRIGWYVDYKARSNPLHPGGALYSPIIGLSQEGDDGYVSTPSGADLDAAIATNLGADWIVGNEPDRRIYQDSMVPAAYAHAYHDVYYAIKAKDPTARVFAGAIVQPTPLRLAYLDDVLRSYSRTYGEAMPVDGWAIHNFILNERSCEFYNDLNLCWGADIPPGSSATDGLQIGIDELQKTGDINFFKEQIVHFRAWMYDRGFVDKPLYVSEYGILMPPDRGFPADVVNQYMTDTFNYMLNQTDPVIGYAADNRRLVQKFSWYSTSDISFNGGLFESTTPNPLAPPFKLTVMGENYRNYTTPIQVASDVNLVKFDVTPSAPLSANAPVTMTLRATVGNAGNNVADATAKVTFYDGDPTAGGVQIGTEQTVKLSGCGMTHMIQAQWPNVPASANGKLVYARVVAPGVDQKLSAKLFFAAGELRLPLVRRGY